VPHSGHRRRQHLAANQELEYESELVYQSPYDEGWLVKIEIAEASELHNLMKPTPNIVSPGRVWGPGTCRRIRLNEFGQVRRMVDQHLIYSHVITPNLRRRMDAVLQSEEGDL
jgi:hypothetical protein